MDGLSRCRVAAVALLIALPAVACARHDRQLQDHEQTLSSVAASVNRIGEAWLSGETSGTFTAVALEQMFQAVEAERAAVAADPAFIRDPRGASLADSASELCRRVALMLGAVQGADSATLRHQLDGLPFITS